MQNSRIIKDISDFIFIKDMPLVSDVIFIPGSTAKELPEAAAKLYRNGYSKLIIPSGKYAKGQKCFSIYGYETEADFFADILKKSGVPDSDILCERNAEYTCQNAFFSRKLTDELGITVNRAIICCKSYHARRCLMYYTFAYPETEFFIHPVDVRGITKDNWYLSAPETVMDELKKCGGQLFDEFSEYIK